MQNTSTAHRSWTVLGMGLAATLAVSACHKHAESDATAKSAGGEVEDLTIVVEADKSRILQEESALKAKKADFETERARLERERTEIADKLSTLSKKDKSQREKLEAAERQLADEQKRLHDKSDSFESERSKLDVEKNRLLERIAKMTQTKGGLTIEQREEAIGRREHDVAIRERDVARREAEAGRGLADVNKLLDEVKGGVAAARAAAQAQVQASNAAAAAPSSGASNATKVSVQRLQKTIRGKMENKGVLPDDLPPTVRDLDANANAAVSSRDYASAQDALNQLGQAVDTIAINHAFVQAKMARINRQFDDKKGSSLDEGRQKKIQGLLAEASDSFSDGRYDRANKKINQIFALLQSK